MAGVQAIIAEQNAGHQSEKKNVWRTHVATYIAAPTDGFSSNLLTGDTLIFLLYVYSTRDSPDDDAFRKKFNMKGKSTLHSTYIASTSDSNDRKWAKQG